MIDETLILRGILSDEALLVSAAAEYEPEYFENRIIRKVWPFITDYYIKYSQIPTPDIIKENLKVEDATAFQEIITELNSLDFDIAEHFGYIFDETNKHLKASSLKDAIIKSVDVLNAGEDYGKIKELVETALAKDLKQDLGLDYFGDLALRLKRILLARNTKKIPSYFPQFDEYINGGFPPYTLSVLVAQIHGWKSATMANMSARQVLHGHNVVLATLEMSQDAFAQRYDSIFTNLDINRMYSIKNISQEMLKKLKEIREQEGRGSLFIKEFPTGRARVEDVRKYLKQLQLRKIPIDIIFVDYINLMRPSYGDPAQTYSSVKNIAESLRSLSWEFDAPVVSVSQLNRIGALLRFDEVNFNYIAESMGLPATADFLTIFGADEDLMVYENTVNYKIGKNRLGGRVGTVDSFYYDSRSLRMYDSTELDLWIKESEISGDERKIVTR